MTVVKPQQQTESTLKDIVNEPEMVSAFGRSYEIKKFTFGPLTQALEFVGPMGYLLRKLVELPRDKKGNINVGADGMLDLAVTAVSVSGASVFGLVSVATREPIEWLEAQDAMDGIKVFAKVLEKNIDFFSQSNIDKIKDIFAGFQDKIPMIGGDTSTNS